MTEHSYQLTVDLKDQLTVAQAMCNHQLMVETQEIRDAFSARLSSALDGVAGVRKERGRNVDLYEGIKDHPAAKASKQATHKWLRGESIPSRGNMIAIAEWLGVRVEWLAYGEGDRRSTADSASSTAETRVASYAVPAVVREISQALADGSLTAEDGEELRRMAQHLITKNRSQQRVAELPAHLDGIAEAAITTAEQGGNPQDMLKMVEHGLKKSQPKEGPQQDGKRKARSS